MPQKDVISLILSEEDQQAIMGHLDAISTIIEPLCLSLTSEQRKDMGRIGNRTENWSTKVMAYMKNQPQFNPAFVDVNEATKDHEAREALKPIANKLEGIVNLVDDTSIALGFDLYHSHLSYYRNVKLLAKQNVNGAKAIYDDLSAQFPGGKRKKSSE